MRWLFLLPLLSACGGGVAVEVSWLEVPESVTLDSAEFGAQNSVAVDVHNIGTASAHVDLAVTGPFELPTIQLDIPAGDVAHPALFFTPEHYGDAAGVLTLNSSQGTLQVSVAAMVNADFDGDGFEAVAAGGDDCDDLQAATWPGNDEICDDIDNDCSGDIDDVAEPPSWFPDGDADGYGDASATPARGCDRPSAGWVGNDLDCDDLDEDIQPDADEIWYDGLDQDCSGGSDFDRDGDGYDNVGTGGDDCQDSDPTSHPYAAEVNDGVDNDCDGLIDELD